MDELRLGHRPAPRAGHYLLLSFMYVKSGIRTPHFRSHLVKSIRIKTLLSRNFWQPSFSLPLSFWGKHHQTLGWGWGWVKTDLAYTPAKPPDTTPLGFQPPAYTKPGLGMLRVHSRRNRARGIGSYLPIPIPIHPLPSPGAGTAPAPAGWAPRADAGRSLMAASAWWPGPSRHPGRALAGGGAGSLGHAELPGQDDPALARDPPP